MFGGGVYKCIFHNHLNLKIYTLKLVPVKSPSQVKD